MARPLEFLVVVQARLASTRLPAKALLPIAGMPSFLLCARRAANMGHRVVLATSTQASDNPLTAIAAAAGIAVVRGPHDDVLARFTEATADLANDGVVVRLTADNILPDGRFVERMVQEFAGQGLDYLATSSPQDGLPFGLSAEVFTVASLRRAQAAANTPFDREHVTPWLRRQGRSAWHRCEGAPAHWSRLRCTLDTFEDYARLLEVFEGESDPVGAPWERLVARIAAFSRRGTEPRCPFQVGVEGRIHSSLTLGTVQLGLRYGVANRSGLPDDEEAAALLDEAVESGITALDTARAYGDSEARIGSLLPTGQRSRIAVVTKLDPLAALPRDASVSQVRDAVDASVFKSAYALRERTIDTLLLHRWSHRSDWGSSAWGRLLELRAEGVIRRLGASVSTPAEAIEALADGDVRHLQCPVNVVDTRWREPAFLAAAGQRSDVVVHARSTFLQGLLLLPAPNWPVMPGYDRDELERLLDEQVARLGRISRADLCLAYVRGLPWVHSLVVGMETVAQLRANLHLARQPAMTAPQREALERALPPLPEAVVNPARWS
jgi:spore coat polysaccharide biosynthesis protein SpsF